MANDQRAKRREGSRRAQAARQRRLEARSRQKNRNIVYAAAAAVVVVIAIVAVVLFQGGGTALGYEVRTLPAAHNPPYEYVRDIEINGELVVIPPTSGNHLGTVSPYGFLGDGLVVENAVHNMEHGAVVIWYKPGDSALVTEVSDLVSQLGRQCIVAGEYENMSFPVAATVWGRVLPQEAFDEAELREFIDTYRGTEGPEAGLCELQS